MATIISRSSSMNALSALAKSRLAEKAKQTKWVEKYPDSLDARLLQNQWQNSAKHDEVQLGKLAKRNDAVGFNTSEILNLSDKEQLVLKGDKVMIIRLGTGEVLYESTRRAGKLLWSLPARREALEQMEAAGAVKKIKLPLVNVAPLAVVKKEELFSTIRKALQDFRTQKEQAQQEYAANISSGKEQAEIVLAERRHSIADSLHHELDSIFEEFESGASDGEASRLSFADSLTEQIAHYHSTAYRPRRVDTENWPLSSEMPRNEDGHPIPIIYSPKRASSDNLTLGSEAAALEESSRIFEKYRLRRADSAKAFTPDSSISSVADDTDWSVYDSANSGVENMLNAATAHLSSAFKLM